MILIILIIFNNNHNNNINIKRFILLLWLLFETKYSRMDQVKFVEDSLWKIWSDMVCLGRSYHFRFLEAVFH